MDPFIGGALISGGASLLGGLLGRTTTVSAGRNAYSHVKGIMRASNEFGFNPLTLLGAVSPMGATQSSNNYLGSAVAESGMMLGDAYAKMQTARTQAKLNVIERQNRDLSRKLTDAMIRPKVAGVYDQRGVGFGTGGANVRQPVGGNNGGGDNSDDSSRSSSDDASLVPTKPLSLFGYPLQPTANTADAEAFASRYGEDFMSPSWFAGWGAFGKDVGTAVYNAGRDYGAQRWKQRLIDQYQWRKKYKPSQQGGFDALTGSTYPAARIYQ